MHPIPFLQSHKINFEGFSENEGGCYVKRGKHLQTVISTKVQLTHLNVWLRWKILVVQTFAYDKQKHVCALLFYCIIITKYGAKRSFETQNALKKVKYYFTPPKFRDI